MNLNFVMAGMMLTLFVLFLAEGVCAMLRLERCSGMPVFFAVIGTPLYDFAAGCVLAANVFLMIRGGKNYLKGRKK
ncbi:MAG: hypothetical protein ACLRSD_06445 [Oscillibacter sp.]